jgi:hypothetical protein
LEFLKYITEECVFMVLMLGLRGVLVFTEFHLSNYHEQNKSETSGKFSLDSLDANKIK